MVSQDAVQLSLGFFAHRPVVVQRHAGQISSDAGLLPIREFDERQRYSERMAACLSDSRVDPDHTLSSMLRQRLYGILADYEDCNDHDALRDDPIFKLVSGRSPEDDPLASQPTLSRFENGVSIAALWKLLEFLTDTGIERLGEHHGGKLPDSVILDLDPTDDETHGHQQLSLFHGYYEQHQYFPMVISEPTTRHIFYNHLRPGAVHAALGAEENLMFVAERLRRARSDMTIHARGDSGFGVPWMYEVCESNGISYTFGIAGNSRLQEYAQGLVDQAVTQFQETKEKQRLFTAFSYKAESWDRFRTIVAKAECQDQGTNLRFIVTSLPVNSIDDPQRLYDDYVQRGESEQRMDELKNGLHMDRLSCHRFMANFWRLLLHTAAYNLLNALRDHEQVPVELRRAQPRTWRSKLIKVAALVVSSTRRVLVQIAEHWPFWNFYRAVAERAALMPSGP
ncbi:MAG: IS1380 family transposase [Acidobacteriia bacterium]|nr:IS1380 family transposase [Terriglobia bacterium]